MRLSEKTKKAIVAAFHSQLPLSDFKIYLFGSRTDNQKRGGDIDLLVVLNSVQDKETVASLKSKVRAEIFKHIPEERIDVTVATHSEIASDEFLKSVWIDCLELI